MTTGFEKILNEWVLLSVNIAILLATELSGQYFAEKGIIHLIALVFVILGISRIFIHYDAYDRYLRLLIRGGSMALVVFSVSHLVEFLGYVTLKAYEDAIFVNVVNFYIMSMLSVAIGAEYFLRTLKKGSVGLIIFLGMSVAVFLLLTILIFMNQISVSLEPSGVTPYVYGLLVVVASVFSINRLINIKRHVSIMVGFVNYFIAAFVLITISALQYVFYDVLQGFGMPDFQIIYVSHFLFYGALSLMFLAFVRLADLGGMYQEAQKTQQKVEEFKKNITA
jgi:hypothetical protein